MKKLVVSLLLFMLLSFPSIKCVNTQDSNNENTELSKELEIVRLSNEDRWEESLVKANEYIAKYKNSRSYHVKGKILNLMGRYDEAISTYESGLRFAENDKVRTLFYYNIASIYQSQEKYSNALTYYQKVINVAETNVALLLKIDLAMCYLYMGNEKKASEIYFEVYPLLDDVENALSSNDKGLAYSTASGLACQLKRGGDDLYLTKKVLDAKKTDEARLEYATKLAFYGHTNEAKENFALVDQSKVSPLDLAEWYWEIGDENKTRYYLLKSIYEETETTTARENWKRNMRRTEKLPVDSWKNARDKNWFRKLVYKPPPKS
jgi:tetratricopeptide (TPR) repeat protein